MSRNVPEWKPKEKGCWIFASIPVFVFFLAGCADFIGSGEVLALWDRNGDGRVAVSVTTPLEGAGSSGSASLSLLYSLDGGPWTPLAVGGEVEFPVAGEIGFLDLALEAGDGGEPEFVASRREDATILYRGSDDAALGWSSTQVFWLDPEHFRTDLVSISDGDVLAPASLSRPRSAITAGKMRVRSR